MPMLIASVSDLRTTTATDVNFVVYSGADVDGEPLGVNVRQRYEALVLK